MFVSLTYNLANSGKEALQRQKGRPTRKARYVDKILNRNKGEKIHK